MREEIDPKLEKLRAEKRSYLEFQKATSELERLTRLVKAYEWTMAVDKVDKAGAGLKQKKAEVEAAKEDVKRGGRECEGMEKEVGEIQRRREKVSFSSESGLTDGDPGNGQRRQSQGLDGGCEHAGAGIGQDKDAA